MHPCETHIRSGAPSGRLLEPYDMANPGYKLQLHPRVRCLDCPGKLYIAKPATISVDLSVHMRNRWHRINVKTRSLMKCKFSDHRALYNAIKKTKAEVVQRLIPDIMAANYPRVNVSGVWNQKFARWVLRFTIRYGNTELLRLLLDSGFSDLSRNINDHLILHYACHLGRYQMVSLLIERGFNPFLKDSKGVCPIDLAVSGGHTALASRLIRTGTTDFEVVRFETPRFPLGRACAIDSAQLVHDILHEGHNPNGNVYECPLSIALQRSSPTIVESLLSAGARLQLVDHEHLHILRYLCKGLPRQCDANGLYHSPSEKLALLIRYGLNLDDLSSSSGSDQDSESCTSSDSWASEDDESFENFAMELAASRIDKDHMY